MACFLVPAGEAIITTVAEKIIEKTHTDSEKSKGIFLPRLKYLNTMLWGGSALLAFEHVWHGEVVPWFPFLTAASDPASASEMLHEMSVVGVGMACVVTGAWIIMSAIAAAIEKRKDTPESEVTA